MGAHLEVLQLDLQVPLVLRVLLRQEDGVAVVARLPQHLDGDLHVEVDLALAALLGIQTHFGEWISIT